MFKRKSSGDVLRVFFVTDVHGSDQCFVKFVNAAAAYKAQVLILGGDITGKRVVPIQPTSNGHYAATMGSGEVRLDSDDEIRGFEKEAANAGLYAFKATTDDVSELESDPAGGRTLLPALCAHAGRAVAGARRGPSRRNGSAADHQLRQRRSVRA